MTNYSNTLGVTGLNPSDGNVVGVVGRNALSLRATSKVLAIMDSSSRTICISRMNSKTSAALVKRRRISTRVFSDAVTGKKLNIEFPNLKLEKQSCSTARKQMVFSGSDFTQTVCNS